MSEYDFSAFARNPPNGMEVQCANSRGLWLTRLRRNDGISSREDFFVSKRDGTFTLYRLGHYDIKVVRPEDAMTEKNVILAAKTIAPILRALGYKC